MQMQDTSPRRSALIYGIVAAAVITVVLVLRFTPQPPTVVVTHWVNVHMMNTALLPHFVQDFNKAAHRTQSGAPIRVDLVLVNSGVMEDELIARAGRGAALDATLANPTLVTPAADHWLGQVNYGAGRTVVDPARSQTLAVTWVGIVTYREMAECMGWPRKEIGFADVVALRQDPQGWASCKTAKTEWGQTPLLSFTDPSSSSTARAMLYALYSVAARKEPEQLTAEDVADPKVAAYVRSFNAAVDHYVYDTATLNSKIYLGPRYGHFYFIAESNLVQLYQGKLAVTVGTGQSPQPLSRPMVFIYPKEGAVAHNHSATLVQASWVTSEQAEAAQLWVAYLREEPQQKAFMGEGFRPGIKIPLADTISSRFGLDPDKPTKVLNTDAIAAPAADAIVDSWQEVKKPGVAVFVADTSGSMQGTKIEEAKKGLKRALDGMAERNRVGFISFNSVPNDKSRFPSIQVAPLSENRFALAKAIEDMRAGGGTALYDAVKQGIEMADAAPGDDEAIRGVVILTDGQANEGLTRLRSGEYDLTRRDTNPHLRGNEPGIPRHGCQWPTLRQGRHHRRRPDNVHSTPHPHILRGGRRR
jgi:Ca-activated chloride channel homolog